MQDERPGTSGEQRGRECVGDGNGGAEYFDIFRYLMDENEKAEQVPSTEELGSNIEVCEYANGGTEFNEPTRLRYIAKRHPTDYMELGNLAEKVVGRFIRALDRKSFGSTRRYVSEVIPCRSNEQHDRIIRRLREAALGYPGRFLIFVSEGDHIHIVHDCAFSNHQCRCYFAKSPDFRTTDRTSFRQRKFVVDMDWFDWLNVFLYFVVSKWIFQPEVWINGRKQGSTTPDEVVLWREIQAKSREILAREDSRDGLHSGREFPGNEDSEEFIPTHLREASKKRGLDAPQGKRRRQSKFARVEEKVSTLLASMLIVPAEYLKEKVTNREDKLFLNDPCNKQCYEAACEIFRLQFNSFKLIDFYNYYLNKMPVFYANNIDPFTYYHNVKESVHFLNKLLQFQFEGATEDIEIFLTNIRDWFNLKGWDGNPKINALLTVGPPNSGKNYFWDTLAAIAYNVGNIGRVNNKTNRFSLQECVQRRFIVGNEISFESGAKEDMKKLLEGAALNINVKHQADKIYSKTPVCLISNNNMDIAHDPHFVDVRLKVFRWKTCEELKCSDLKPYPIALFEIFKLYNVSLQ